jgi:hypothetical protein
MPETMLVIIGFASAFALPAWCSLVIGTRVGRVLNVHVHRWVRAGCPLSMENLHCP